MAHGDGGGADAAGDGVGGAVAAAPGGGRAVHVGGLLLLPTCGSRAGGSRAVPAGRAGAGVPCDLLGRLGWADRYGLAAATARQRHYAAQFLQSEVYTPELVIDGWRQAVGSDRPAVLAALRAAAQERAPPVPLTLLRGDGRVRVGVGRGAGQGTVLLIGFDSQHRTPVTGGENGGQTLVEANVVRALDVLGDWQGAALLREVPMPAGEHLAVLLQAPDGRILGAAVLP
jgi:hypothetical protein